MVDLAVNHVVLLSLKDITSEKADELVKHGNLSLYGHLIVYYFLFSFD